MAHRIMDRLAAGLALGALALALPAGATVIKHWVRKPLNITLPVGQERIVILGSPARIGLPKRISAPDTLRVQSNGGAVYLRAKKPFDTARVQFQDVQSGRIVLVNLSAKKHASDETIRVVAGDRTPPGDRSAHSTARAKSKADGAGHHGSPSGGDTGQPLPVRLVRHAAQALYAPQRLIESGPGIKRVKLAHSDRLPGLLPSLPVTARPVAAWRGGRDTVTAIHLTNRDTQRTFRLDPRVLVGDFVAASFMQTTVGPAHSDTDATTLFVVTRDGGLAQALPGLNAPGKPTGDHHAD